MNKKCVFLDRDGVINHDYGYVGSKSRFIFIDGVIEALQTITKLGYDLIIVTNQSGIGRGYFTKNDFEHLMKHMCRIFSENGIKIKSIYYCPHSPSLSSDGVSSACRCRKPSPTLILQALEKYNYDPAQCYLIGDKTSDIEAGHQAEISNLVLLTGKNENLNLNYSYSKFKSLLDFAKDLT